MNTIVKKPFNLGKTVITANADSVLDITDIHVAMGRHISCDWGNLCDEDRERNNNALRNGARLFSAYKDSNGRKFWIITEADRSYTTVLLPEDY